jgi:cobalt/nickel transport system ATP-binding protein
MSRNMVEVTDLFYKYPDGTPALNGINLSIKEGESVAIVGHNGAGKSTMLKHLNGILKGHGSIRIDGLPVDKKNLKTIRSYVGMVFQDPDDQLFCPTVYEDVAFGLINMDMEREEIKRRVEQTLREVGLTGFEQRSAHHLSYGQKKRVAVATILSMLPKILVFDEPTSNLDPLNEKTFLELVKSLPGTKLIVSHDLPILFQLCERFVVMSKGQIIEDTTREKFMHNKKLIRENGLDYSFKCLFCEHYAQNAQGELG